MDKISIGEAAITGLLGYAVVFVGLVMLLVVVTLIGKAMTASRKKTAPAPAAPASPDLPAPEKKALPEARGTGGEILLNNVPEREAAVVMAVVAYRLGKPLNQLRFKSIREVKNDEV